MHVKSLLDTRLFPCSIEKLNSDNLAICGCYELDEASGTRQGELLLLGIESDNGEFMIDVTDKVTLEAGILDCKVLGGGFYAGLSTETLVHYLVNDQQGYRITETASISRPDEGLFLSVSPIITGSEATVAVSTQSGSILVYQHNDSDFRETIHIKACHPMFDEPMPVWIVALNQHNDSVLVSGGDDMKLRFWDLRQGEMPIATKKIHDAGVTTAQWHPHHENIVAVGSYDESCSIWDYRSLREPLVRFETGGGVWRSKWIRSVPGDNGSSLEYIATANMQGGSNIFQLNLATALDESAVTEVLHTEHYIDDFGKHLSYGIDVLSTSAIAGQDSKSGKQEVSFSALSCSFYDRKVSLWDATFEEHTL